LDLDTYQLILLHQDFWRKLPTIEDDPKQIPTRPLMRPQCLAGDISGSTIIVRENNPEPPMPCKARNTISWLREVARPLASAKAENSIQAITTAIFRPMPSLSLAKIIENPACGDLAYAKAAACRDTYPYTIANSSRPPMLSVLEVRT
jgi:hypothetical protein